jgi:hypothetical protein
MRDNLRPGVALARVGKTDSEAAAELGLLDPLT